MAVTFGAAGVIPDVVESQDPTTLLAKVRASFAAQLVAHADSQLIDVYLSGGGAGQVFQATMLYSQVENGRFPQLADQSVALFFGTDRRSVKAAMVAFYAAHTTVRTTFNDAVSGGDGAMFVSLLCYQPDDSELAFRSLMSAPSAEEFAEPALDLETLDAQATARARLQERKARRAEAKQARRAELRRESRKRRNT